MAQAPRPQRYLARGAPPRVVNTLTLLRYCQSNSGDQPQFLQLLRDMLGELHQHIEASLPAIPEETTQHDPLRTWTIDAGVSQHSRAPLHSPRMVSHTCSMKAAPQLRNLALIQRDQHVDCHAPLRIDQLIQASLVSSRSNQPWRSDVLSLLPKLHLILQELQVRPRANRSSSTSR